eukprot:CAMPEP_0180796558 /NCGR_PEP_ID=MMETSP1038_2-20121128/56861_1 /TAXON_ID=632150 /ORGANISM="Azadinium spinosum, Strain 3D9" /LENGTH=46 /DNA_ID= /DNA_START= /DNA_END= /DNA_ORIENTATION=
MHRLFRRNHLVSAKHVQRPLRRRQLQPPSSSVLATEMALALAGVAG